MDGEVCLEDEGEGNGSNTGEGMASMRVAVKRANGEWFACVCSKEVVSPRRGVSLIYVT